MARMNKAEKAIETRITALFTKSFSGVLIPIMKVGDVYNAGKKAIVNGGDDQAVTDAMAHVVNQVKV